MLVRTRIERHAHTHVRTDPHRVLFVFNFPAFSVCMFTVIEGERGGSKNVADVGMRVISCIYMLEQIQGKIHQICSKCVCVCVSKRQRRKKAWVGVKLKHPSGQNALDHHMYEVISKLAGWLRFLLWNLAHQAWQPPTDSVWNQFWNISGFHNQLASSVDKEAECMTARSD